jgi:Helix-hairpin-helix motif
MRRWLLVLFGIIVIGFSEQLASTAAEPACVDINTASPEELMRIVHIDAVRAAEAVEIREHRPFADVTDLTRIRGIGPSRLIDIEGQGLACVGREAPAGTRPEIAGRARIVDGDRSKSATRISASSASMLPRTTRSALMAPRSGYAARLQRRPSRPWPREPRSDARCTGATVTSAHSPSAMPATWNSTGRWCAEVCPRLVSG